MERALRGVIGVLVLISVALTQFVHPAWMWFTVFIGANMIQSSVTNFCPMRTLFKKLGMKE